jgi:hypothetical protein
VSLARHLPFRRRDGDPREAAVGANHASSRRIDDAGDVPPRVLEQPRDGEHSSTPQGTRPFPDDRRERPVLGKNARVGFFDKKATVAGANFVVEVPHEAREGAALEAPFPGLFEIEKGSEVVVLADLLFQAPHEVAELRE